MKELSIEEKARRYDEAIEIAKEINNEQRAQPFNVMTRVFPELAESEDERMKEAIIATIHLYYGELLEDKAKEMIAWLEKQSKDSPVLSNSSNTGKDEQKHVEWSADDLPEFESYLCLMLQKFRTKGICTNGEIVDFIKEHSQKLKDTLCHPWSEEDEQNYDTLLKIICSSNKSENLVNELFDWFKSLKNRVQLKNLIVTDEELAQAKKDAYNNALDKIEYYSSEPTFDDGWSAAIWYLKKRNIQLCHTWKPSNEQITWLYRAADEASKDSRMKQVLNNLLSDLKKL